MNQSEQSMRVEPLPYHQMVGVNVWSDVMKVLALAVLLAGIGMISSGVNSLWLYGVFGKSPIGSRTPLNNISDIMFFVAPTMVAGVALLSCSIAVLSGARWGLTAMRAVMIAMLVLLLGMAASRVAINRTSLLPSTPSSVSTYQAISAFNYLLTQSVLPLLVLGVLRIYRRSSQPGF